MLNVVTLVGRLAREVQYFAGKEEKKSVAVFSLAFSQGIEETGFIDCKAFGKSADLINEWLVKGDKIGLSGSLHQRKFERKDGSKSSTIEIHVDSIEFLDVLKQAKEPEEADVEDVPEELPEEKPVEKLPRRRR